MIWSFYIVWYLFTIIFPNSFYKVSESTLEKQKISSCSKLQFIYAKKNSFPKLKCIALEAIIFFFL